MLLPLSWYLEERSPVVDSGGRGMGKVGDGGREGAEGVYPTRLFVRMWRGVSCQADAAAAAAATGEGD